MPTTRRRTLRRTVLIALVAGAAVPAGAAADSAGKVTGTGNDLANALVPAAKRQAMRPNGTVIAGSAVAWRPVLQNVAYANRWGWAKSCDYSEVMYGRCGQVDPAG